MIGWLECAEPGACDLLRSLKEDADKHFESPSEPLSARAFLEITHLRKLQREAKTVINVLVEIATGDSIGGDLLPMMIRRARDLSERLDRDFILAGEAEFFDARDDLFDTPEQSAERAA